MLAFVNRPSDPFARFSSRPGAVSSRRSGRLNGVERIAAAFARAKAERRVALIPYLCAGDPDAATTAAILAAIVPSVDLIELGIPYGDPLADGPTIAAAAQRALVAGTGIDAVVRIAREARARGSAELLFFTYVNPVVQYGAARFAAAARHADVLGAIVPDVPL